MRKILILLLMCLKVFSYGQSEKTYMNVGEKEPHIDTIFNSLRHFPGHLIVFLPNGNKGFPEFNSKIKNAPFSESTLTNLGSPKVYLIKFAGHFTQYAFDYFRKEKIDVSFDEVTHSEGDGVINISDPQISSYESDIYGSPASVDEDSLRAFLKPSLRNNIDDADETVKLVMTELVDPIYIGNELPDIDTVNSYNYATGNQNFSTPLFNHGSFVVSGAMAKENGFSMVGISSVGKYISINYCENSSFGASYTSSGHISMLNWAVSYLQINPTKGLVISKSHGGFGFTTPLQDVYNSLISINRAIICHSAGNSNSDIPEWEEAQNFPWYISCGATDAIGNKASISDWGTWVDCYFQGQNVFGLNLGGSGATQSTGTSFSAPRVAGMVNKIWNALGGPGRVSASQLTAAFQNNQRVKVLQPDNSTKPIAHGWDIMMRFVNHMEESHPAAFDAVSEPIIDLKQWTRTTWFPQMINVAYYIKVNGVYQLLPNGILNTGQYCTGSYEFKIVWDNNGVPGTNGANTTSTILRYKAINNGSFISPFATQSTSTSTVCSGTSNNVTFTISTNAPAGSTFKLKDGSTVLLTTTTNPFTYNVGSLPVGIHNFTTEVSFTSGGCYTTNIATSNTSSIEVVQTLAPAVSIAATPSGTVCGGTNITFTATPTNAGATSSYQWKVNGADVGTNSNTFTTNTLANGNVVTVVMTPTSGGCYTASTATSNSITAQIIANVTPSVSISANPSTTICSGTNVTYSATTNVVGATYQWKLNGVNVGTNSATYSVTPTNGDVINVMVSAPSGGCYAPTSVSSNSISASVTTSIVPTASITASVSGSVCAGTSVTYTANTNIISANYHCKLNGANVGSNAPTYTVAPANGDIINVVVTAPSGGCFSPSSATSNSITATVTANITPTAIIVANTTGAVCAGSSVTYTATTNVSGASYQWKLNGANVGTNSATYSVAPVNGDVINLVVTAPSGACYSASSITSNSITANVTTNVTPTANVSANPSGTVCAGTSVIYSATTNVTGAIYQWKSNSANVGTNSSIYSVVPVNGDNIVVLITVPSGGCYTASSVASNTVTASVNPSIIPTVSITVNPTGSVCSGTNLTFTANTNVANANFQWQVNGGNAGSNNATFSTTTLANADLVRVQVSAPSGACYTPASVLSNNLSATIQPSQSLNIAITATAYEVNLMNPVVITVSNPSTSMTYTLYKNGVSTAQTGTSFTITEPGTYAVVAAPISGVCWTAASYESNKITLTAKPEVIRLYPSPAKTYVVVDGLSLSDKWSKLVMYNSKGRRYLVQDISGSSSTTIRTIQNLAGGKYFIRLISESGSFKTLSFIK